VNPDAVVLPGLAYAYGGPPVSARLRVSPEDFQVRELPLVEPDGSGEHAWLWIRKRNENTDHVAGLLAQHAGVHPREVSYAGLKDRNAVTEQWFSVHLPGRPDPEWAALDSETVTVLRHARHTRKLQRGTLHGNAFRIVLRDVQGDRARLQDLLQQVKTAGVPNYFGVQRFGIDGSNLQTAALLFRNPRMKLSRNRRSLALSAARSLLFNAVLARRVEEHAWSRALPGDALQLAGSHSFFIAEAGDAGIARRVAEHDIHPTGPLVGKGESPVQDECRALEQAVLSEYGESMAGLAAAGLRQERRALRLPVTDLHWHWPQADELVLEFSLPSGCYATSVLRELADSRQAP
jgi:tRNA pseudouridine13 synthase